MTPLFQVRNVWLRRSTPEKKTLTDILRDVSLEIPKGRISTLLGPSGAGKSSLLRLFNRLEDPSEGAVLLDGSDIRTQDIIQLRRRVGMVAQIPTLFATTVEKNLSYGPGLKHQRVTQQELRRLLDLVGLPHEFLTRDARTLSVGEQKRVALARVLANRPEVLLLDEPTAALDPTSTGTILNLVQELKEKLGITIVFVTHIMEEAKAIGQEVVVLDEGRVLAQGVSPGFFDNPPSEIVGRFLNGNLGRVAL